MGDSRGRPVNHRPGADDRAVTPSVGKALEGGIVVLFVGLLTTMLLGGLVPDYRAATGAELGDRVLATASQAVERAVPPTARAVDVRRSVDLPSSIAGEGYEIRTDGRWLVLDHPDPAVGGRVRRPARDRRQRRRDLAERGRHRGGRRGQPDRAGGRTDRRG